MEPTEIAIARKTIEYSSDEIMEIFRQASPIFLKKCQKDFKFFGERFFGLTMDEPHLEIIKNIEENSLSLIEMSRGAGKSMLLTKSYPVWRLLRLINIDHIYNNPFKKPEAIMVVSSSQEQSNSMVEDLKSFVLTNPVLRILLLPEKLSDVKWSAEKITFRNGCSIKSKPLTPSARGFHGDLIIVDDLLKDTQSKTLEDQLVKRFFSIIFPMIWAKFKGTRMGKMIICGTPQSDNDLYRQIESKKTPEGDPLFHHDRFPIVNRDSDGNWTTANIPSRFPIPKIKLLQSSMPADTFNREYLLIPVDSTNSYFNYDILYQQTYDGDMLPEIGNGNRFVMGVDVALSSKSTADYTVFTILQIEKGGTVRLVGIFRQKGLGESEIENMIYKFEDRFSFDAIMMEKAPINYGMCDRMEEKALLSNLYFYVPTEKTRMNILSQLKVRFNTGELWIPNHDILMDELLKFKPVRDSNGRWKVQGVGAHDDIVMSLAMAIDAYINYGGVVGLETLDDENLISFRDSEFDKKEQEELMKEAIDTQINVALKPDIYL